jgi:VanZ family protein
MSSSPRSAELGTARLLGARFAKRSGARYWISAWLPVVVGAIIIAIESTERFGSNHTSGPLRILFEALFGRVSDASWGVIHHYIRKSGHFIGYGLLGLAWLRAWRMTMPRARFLTAAALALFGTAVVAICDEWHQSYLPNRSSSPWDVLLDCCGAIVIISAVYIVRKLTRTA